jgi:very-short-patch-repair endonuclease
VTRQLARVLRTNATRPEREAWELLRTLRSERITVRRQHPIGRYIADFAIMRARVAIEIDGPLHETQKEADAERDKAFAILGWRVLRFTPDQLTDGPKFLAAVRAALSPSPRGEGAGGEEKHRRAPSKATKLSSTEAPLTPQPPLLAERGSGEFPAHLRRRTRANRKLPPCRKT